MALQTTHLPRNGRTAATAESRARTGLRTSTEELLGLAREARPGAKKESPRLRRLMTLSEDLDEEKLKELVVMAGALGR